MTSTSAEPSEPWILYDGQCPFCSSYVRMVRLRDSLGPVRLVDAREGGPELAELHTAGYDIDAGMALKMDGRLFHGDDCLNRIALLTTPSGAFNRLNAWVFRSGRRSRALYPVLRAGRNAALRLLGRRGINAGGHSQRRAQRSAR